MSSRNIDSSTKTDVFEAFAAVMKATANGCRLELLEVIAQGEHSVEDLASLTGLALTRTSAHLQSLKRSGLVLTRRERTSIYYRLAGNDVAELFVHAKRMAVNLNPQLKETLQAHLSDPCAQTPTVAAASVTSNMVVVDVRPRDEYEAAHFPGAVSIPLAELEERQEEIRIDAEVVLYGRSEFCRLGREAAVWLRGRGIDARAMTEGILEWRATKEVSLEAG